MSHLLRRLGQIGLTASIIATSLLTLSPLVASAVTFEWTDPVTGFFNSAANWTPTGGPPGAGDNIVFNETGSYDVGFKLDHTSDEVLVTDGDVRFLSNSASVSTLTLPPDGGITDADIEVNGGSSLTIGNVGSPVFVDGEDAILFAGVTTNGTVSVVGAGSKLVANGTSRTHPIGAVGGIGVLIVASGGQADIGEVGGVLDIGVSNTGSSQGFVLVDTGGLLRTNTLSVGTRTSAAEGTVTVSGTGSTIGTGGGATIGSTSGGTGTVNVESAGTFSTSTMSIRATGTLNVLEGNVFTSNTTLAAGGTVLIDGGQYFSQAGFDNSAGGTITHRDGLLMITDGAFVPNASGNYTIDGTAVPDSPEIKIGFEGTANFGTLRIGATRSAQLTVEDGGIVTTNNAILGDKPDASGFVAVTDLGSHWTVTSQLTVGFQGDGSVDISDGGLLTTSTAVIGNSSGSISDIRVRQTDSRLHVQSDLFVGGSATTSGGDGTLFVETGGTVDVDDQLKIWPNGEVRLTGGTLNLGGNMNVAGGVLTYVSGTLNLGANRSHVVNDGEFSFNEHLLTVNNGNSLLFESNSSLSGVSLNLGDGSAGALILDDSLYTRDAEVFTTFGRQGGIANVTLRNGSTAQVDTLGVAMGSGTSATIDIEAGNMFRADETQVAPDATSTATINLAGNLFFNTSSSLALGSNGAGTGTATINVDGGTLRSGATTINTTGTINIDNNGEFITTSILLLDGGVVNVINGTFQAGGNVTAVGNAQLNISGSLAIDTVRDYDFSASELDVSGGINLTGNSSFIFQNGTTAVSSSGNITDDSTVFVNDSGTQWQTGQFTIGNSSNGSLFILDGGQVMSADVDLALGSIASGEATVRINGSGSTWTIANSLLIGGLSSSVEGDGAVNIEAGGLLDVGAGILIQQTSAVNLDGGQIVAASIDRRAGSGFNTTAGTVSTGSFTGDHTNAGATLQIETFTGNLVNQGGILAPGSSAGSTTIVGDYTQQTGATLEIEIGGTIQANEYDFVNVTGTALIDGLLDLSLLDGFAPDATDNFTILAADNLAGAFDNVASGGRLATSDGIGSFRVDFDFGTDLITLSEFELTFTADFDADGDVDSADLNDPTLGWQARYGNDLDGSNFLDWQRQFGSGVATSAASQAVPEPAALWILFTALACLSERRTRTAMRFPCHCEQRTTS